MHLFTNTSITSADSPSQRVSWELLPSCIPFGWLSTSPCAQGWTWLPYRGSSFELLVKELFFFCFALGFFPQSWAIYQTNRWELECKWTVNLFPIYQCSPYCGWCPEWSTLYPTITCEQDTKIRTSETNIEINISQCQLHFYPHPQAFVIIRNNLK